MSDNRVIHIIEPDGDPGRIALQIDAACDAMEHVYAGGHYPKLTVHRRWSDHNPEISGQLAHPAVYRWYLHRELSRLVAKGARILVSRSRERIELTSPELLTRIDEIGFDITRKKVFLFGPERCELSIARLSHYTGTRCEDFQRYVLLTNYQMHLEAFAAEFPDCIRSSRPGVQMPAMHHVREDNAGITIVNIGVGPSNAKTFSDHLAVLRPDAMVMVGHCAGVRNHQDVGDFVLASGYMRADRILDHALPTSVPIAPSFLINRQLAWLLDERELRYRTGTVYTTADRNWELSMTETMRDLRVSRSIAVDMESATLAANGFRYRIPSAALLCVSDKPLHGLPKLPGEAKEFYETSKRLHLSIAIDAFRRIREDHPGGLPTSEIRSPDEALLGGE